MDTIPFPAMPPKDYTTFTATVWTDGGPWAKHNQGCFVCRTDEPAVLDLNTGIFQPCWPCQKQGYRVNHLTRFQKWLIGDKG